MPKGDVPVTFMVSTSVVGFWFLHACVSLTFYWGLFSIARFQLEVGWVQKTMRCWNLVRHAGTHEWRTYLHESIFTNKHPSQFQSQDWPRNCGLYSSVRCPVRGGLVSYPSSCWDNAHPRALSFGARMCLGLNGWKRWCCVGGSVSKDSDNEWLG